MFQPDHGNDAAEEQVDFLIFPESRQRLFVHEAEIRMVKNHFGPHVLHKTVETFRRKTLKPRIRFPVIPDAVHDIAAFVIFVHHGVYGINVVLQIRIDADGRVTVGLHRHKAGQHRILMPFVVSQANAGIYRILLTKLLNHFPGTVPASVIHKTDFTVFADLFPRN